jgi:hypothetical protein
MSWPLINSTPTPNNADRWGKWGPGLNAYHLDRMGWISRDRILRFGADGIYSTVVQLAPLSSPEKPGYLLIRIPINR